MPDRTYELRLASGRVVQWDGASPEDASRRYVGAHPGETVVAWRHVRPDLRIGTQRILEPGDKGW